VWTFGPHFKSLLVYDYQTFGFPIVKSLMLTYKMTCIYKQYSLKCYPVKLFFKGWAHYFCYLAMNLKGKKKICVDGIYYAVNISNN